MTAEFDEKTVFLHAAALEGEAREAYLRQSCPDESALLRIRTLLEHHAEASATKHAQPARDASTIDAPQGYPAQIDEFRILGRIGEGGMGTVYLAEDTVLGRRVALKVLARHLIGSESALARFTTEARSAAALNHPAIVPVFKLGFDGESHYIVSELVDGPTLAAVLADERERRKVEGRTADLRAWQRRASDYVLAIADALEASHRAGIIHRDVKPSNILIDQIHGARLTDFGIARHLAQEGDARVTARIGTCHYMSPEQASLAAAKIDQRSDVFSLGVVMYEALSLLRPFEGRDVDQVLRAVIATEPARLRRLDRSIPKDLETICHKALEKQPERRYQSAAHMAADLRCWLTDRPILARPPGVPRRARDWTRRHAREVSAAAMLLLALASLGLYLNNQRTQRAMSGHLIIAERMQPARVLATLLDPDDLSPGTAVELGVAPLDRYLEPGLYRLVFVLPEGTRLEASSLLPAGAADEVWVNRPAADAMDAMMLVPAGTHELGREGASDAFEQQRSVTLPAFGISETEVSNAEYREYVEQAGAKPPAHWSQPYDAAIDDLPVAGISWDEANQYCRWRGVRLPTPDEWEAAARRPHGWMYPWGNDPRADIVRPDVLPTVALYRQHARAVGSEPELATKPDAQGKTLYHMASNVVEYVEGIDASKNGGILLKGRSFMSHRDISSTKTSSVSGRHLPSIDRGFRVAATQFTQE